jgi:DNA-binding MarR family transcriptional regulator
MTDNVTMTKIDYEILAEFRYTLRLFEHFSLAAIEKAGLTPQQHQALLAIKGFPGREQITIRELAERLLIRHHSAVGLVNRLESENLIIRSSALDDRRKVLISLSKYGLSILESLSASHLEELHRLSPQLRLLLERMTKLSEGRKSTI